jgi:hypothetical protein
MPPTIADKIKKTQNSFPSQPTGSVVPCPFKNDAQNEALTSPVEVETGFQLTQPIGQSTGVSPAQEKPKEKKAWIEIILVDNDGKPMSGVKYRITPPSGAPVEGTLDQNGQAGLYQIEPGNCKITFPDLDREAWD